MPVIRDVDGRLWRATGPASLPVLAVVHCCALCDEIVEARQVGEASSLADAERLARTAGFAVLAPARFVDAANGIHVMVVRG